MSSNKAEKNAVITAKINVDDLKKYTCTDCTKVANEATMVTKCSHSNFCVIIFNAWYFSVTSYCFL